MQVTVIIPCYNVAGYIEKALQSVLIQGECVAEIICVDDGSNDETVSLIEKFISQNRTIRILLERNYINAGASFARNKALALAKGDYIQFLDADDYLLPGKISNQLELCGKNLPGIIIGNYIRKMEGAADERVVKAYHGNIFLALMKSRLGCTCSNLWRKTDLLRVGGFESELKSSQEYNLMFNLIKSGTKLIFDKDPLTIVIDRKEKSISSFNRGENWKRYVELRIKIIDFVKSAGKMKESEMKDFYGELFDALRSWYPFAPEEAFRTFQDNIPANFVPSVSQTTSWAYIFIYRLFGFRRTEWLKKILK